MGNQWQDYVYSQNQLHKITKGVTSHRKPITFTFTFRAFSRRFCPKLLTPSTFVAGKKPQHIIVDRVKKKKKNRNNCQSLLFIKDIVAAVYKRI